MGRGARSSQGGGPSRRSPTSTTRPARVYDPSAVAWEPSIDDLGPEQRKLVEELRSDLEGQLADNVAMPAVAVVDSSGEVKKALMPIDTGGMPIADSQSPRQSARALVMRTPLPLASFASMSVFPSWFPSMRNPGLASKRDQSSKARRSAGSSTSSLNSATSRAVAPSQMKTARRAWSGGPSCRGRRLAPQALHFAAKCLALVL
jgi:hypothetical protein